jgi:preprotein translocase subunit SecA
VKEEDIDQHILHERINQKADDVLHGKIAVAGEETFRRMAKTFLLQLLDQHWKEHLLNLDHLRQGINLRAFGQRDPLNEYKAEAFALFESMMNNLREAVTQTLSFVEINISPEVMAALQKQQAQLEAQQKKLQETRDDPALSGGEDKKKANNVTPIRKAAFDENDSATWGDTPRNSPCPCGSGKKYKHCHGTA